MCMLFTQSELTAENSQLYMYERTRVLRLTCFYMIIAIVHTLIILNAKCTRIFTYIWIQLIEKI